MPSKGQKHHFEGVGQPHRKANNFDAVYSKHIVAAVCFMFIPIFVFGFWSLLAIKLKKYKNIK